MFFRPKPAVEDFEAVAMPHLADLYRSASFLTRDSSKAEDLVQEVYLEAWKSFHRFEPGTNCRAWLFKIMFHRLHHLRRSQEKASRVESLEGGGRQDRLAADPPVPQEIRDEDILMALGKIPGEFRQVVLLADVEEFSYKEIARSLGVPLGTIMSRLSRGRKLLREQLAEVAQSYGIRERAEGKGQGESA